MSASPSVAWPNLPPPDGPLCDDGRMTIEISALTARRYVMGRGGLWPGRRWRGLDGTGTAMRVMEDLQLDPLVIVARAHDLMLHSRVADYAIDDWATLTYERREFFEWGGWLAVRPMDELPYFRVLMRRERERGHWLEVERDHHDAIEEMRTLLRSGREVSNRSFAMGDRTRIDHYRGRKDSALALHYLWRVGEAMVSRRERFERVYALTEAVAPPSALREVDDAEADDVLSLKAVAAAGLTRLNGVKTAYVYGHKATPAEVAEWRDRWLTDGSLVEVKVEGWRATQVAPGGDASLIADLEAGRIPKAWTPLEDHDRRGGDLPVAARTGLGARPGEGAVRLRLHVGGVHAGGEAQVRLLRVADPVGRPARRSVRSEAGPDDRHARHPRPVAGGRRPGQGCGFRRRARGRDAPLHDAPRCPSHRRRGRHPAVAPAPARAVGHATRPLVGQLTATSRLSDWAVAGRRATTTRTTPQASTSAAAPSIAAPRPAPTETKPMSGG